VKRKLLWSFRANFYGSELRDINDPSVEDVCITLHKGLKWIWQLPLCTHSGIVAICDLLSLRLEFVCHCAGFIVKCLKSSNGVVKTIATHGIYVQRMMHNKAYYMKRITSSMKLVVHNVCQHHWKLTGPWP